PLRQIKLEPFVKEFVKAKEEGKTGKKRRNAKPRYLGTLRYRLELLRGYLPEYGLGDLESEHLTDFLESRPMSGRTWNNYRAISTSRLHAQLIKNICSPIRR